MIAQMHKYFNERNAWLIGVGNMGFYIALCLGCYILGIGVIGVSFYVQHLENLHRPKGYHLKATVKKLQNGQRQKKTAVSVLFIRQTHHLYCYGCPRRKQVGAGGA